MTLPDLEQTSVAIAFGALLISIGLAVWDWAESKMAGPSFKDGGVPERFGVLIFVYMAAVQAIAYANEGTAPRYEMVDQVSVLSDLIGLAGFLTLALNARRFWPLFCTALQGCSLIFHYARDILPSLIPTAYAIQKSTPTTLALLIVMFALIHRRWRVSRNGWDVDWAVTGYSQLHEKTTNRSFLWEYLKTYGRSWLGIPGMIWGALVLVFCALFAWNGGSFPWLMALLGLATLAAAYLYHRQEADIAADRARVFDATYGVQAS